LRERRRRRFHYTRRTQRVSSMAV